MFNIVSVDSYMIVNLVPLDHKKNKGVFSKRIEWSKGKLEQISSIIQSCKSNNPHTRNPNESNPPNSWWNFVELNKIYFYDNIDIKFYDCEKACENNYLN